MMKMEFNNYDEDDHGSHSAVCIKFGHRQLQASAETSVETF